MDGILAPRFSDFNSPCSYNYVCNTVASERLSLQSKRLVKLLNAKCVLDSLCRFSHAIFSVALKHSPIF